MSSTVIRNVTTREARYKLKPGEGTDSVHSEPVYSYAVTELHAGSGLKGAGLAFTLGPGNDLVCSAAALLAERIAGREIESLMSEFGTVWRGWAEHPQLRWLGPHKGVVHLALASVHRCDFLVTWNCRHLANANKFGHIRRVNTLLGLYVPSLVTPLELLEDDGNED